MTRTKQSTSTPRSTARKTGSLGPVKRTRPAPAPVAASKSHALAAAAPPAPLKPNQSKIERLIRLLHQETGASLAEISAALCWQTHSIRGAMSGTLRKKRGLTIERTSDANGVSRYRVVG